MASIRYHAEVLCVLCTWQKPDGAHTTLASVAKPDSVYMTHCARSYDKPLPVLLKAYRLRVERTVHVAKPNDVQTTLGSVAKLDGVHTTQCARTMCAFVATLCTLCTSPMPMASIRHTVHVYKTLRLGVVHSVYVAKPDDIQTTLGSVAKTDGVHKTLGSVAKPDGIHTTHSACS